MHSPPDDTAVRPWPAVAALVATAALWSLGGPLIKLLGGMGGVVEPAAGASIAFYRSLIGGLFFLPMAWSRRGSLAAVSPAWLIGTVVSFTVMTLCFVVATIHTAAANAIILQYTSPIWVFLLSPLLLRERANIADGAALLLGMFGVGIIFFGSGGADTFGLAIALLSGVGYGALTVMIRGLRRVHVYATVSVNCLGSALVLAPVVVWSGGLSLTPGQLGLIAVLGIVQFSAPYALFSYALKRIEAHRAALILLVETIFNPAFTYLVVGEAVPPATLIGGPLILLSVIGWLLLSARPVAARSRPA
ncbi:MAG TPA: DMT family transporter [Phycisphaerae bacterium]|nr:DMT family transporter [Phycisphaerae bacterium]